MVFTLMDQLLELEAKVIALMDMKAVNHNVFDLKTACNPGDRRFYKRPSPRFTA